MEQAKPYHVLYQENVRLKERLRELEAKFLELHEKTIAAGVTDESFTRVLKLVKQKDQALQQYSKELELTNQRLQRTVEELQQKNMELETGLATLRLYQEIFDNEPTAMIGLDKEGRIIQYNAAAVGVIGEQIHHHLLQEVSSLALENFHPDIPAIVTATLQSGKHNERKFRRDGDEFTASAFALLGLEGEVRGAALKIGKIIA